jgi:hypothetical protein
MYQYAPGMTIRTALAASFLLLGCGAGGGAADASRDGRQDASDSSAVKTGTLGAGMRAEGLTDGKIIGPPSAGFWALNSLPTAPHRREPVSPGADYRLLSQDAGLRP